MTRIAIIGTGNVGSAVGAGAAKAGYDVVFAGQDADKAETVAEDAGGSVGHDAARGRRRRRHRRARRALQRGRGRRAGDRARRRGQDRHRPDQPAQGRLLRARHRPRHLGRRARSPPSCRTPRSSRRSTRCSRPTRPNPAAHGTQLDSLFATDDEAAKDAVCGLSGSIGFRPVHVGPLAAARELEAMAWLNIRMQMLTGGQLEHRVRDGRPARGGAHLRPLSGASAAASSPAPCAGACVGRRFSGPIDRRLA